MKFISLFVVIVLCSCITKVQTRFHSQVNTQVDIAKSLNTILAPFKKDFEISEKISCDFNNDGFRDYVMILVNKMEHKIKMIEDSGVYETVYPVEYNSSLPLRRYLLILEGEKDNNYIISICSDRIIPDRNFAEELTFNNVIVPSYLPLSIDNDILTLTIQKKLSTGQLGKELHQMNLRFRYDKSINNWILQDCLSKYKASVRAINSDFDGECLLAKKDLPNLFLTSFNVYDLFDTESLGCNGWKQIVEKK